MVSIEPYLIPETTEGFIKQLSWAILPVENNPFRLDASKASYVLELYYDEKLEDSEYDDNDLDRDWVRADKPLRFYGEFSSTPSIKVFSAHMKKEITAVTTTMRSFSHVSSCKNLGRWVERKDITFAEVWTFVKELGLQKKYASTEVFITAYGYWHQRLYNSQKFGWYLDGRESQLQVDSNMWFPGIGDRLQEFLLGEDSVKNAKNADQPKASREEIHVLTRNGLLATYFTSEDLATAFMQRVRLANESSTNWSIETCEIVGYDSPLLILKEIDGETKITWQLHRLSEYMPYGG